MEDDQERTFRRVAEAGRAHVAEGRRRLETLLARYRHRSAVDIGLRILERDRDAAGTVVGSAIAFRFFLFFLPLLVFGVGLAGIVSGSVDAETVIDQTSAGGTLAEQITSSFDQSATTGWLTAATGFVGMVWAGRALAKVLVAASSLAWRQPVRPSAPVKVIGGIVSTFMAITAATIVVNRIREEFGITVAGLSFVGALAFYCVAWFALLFLLPRPTPDPGVLLPGAVIIGASVTGLQVFSQLYLAHKLGGASSLYGALGTSAAALGYFFLAGRVIVFAMAVNAVLAEQLGSLSHFVFGLPIVRALPRRSPRLRAFFGIDAPEDSAEPSSEPSEPSPR